MAEILEGEFLELAGNFIALSIVRRVLERKGRKKPKSWEQKLLRKRKTLGAFHTLVKELRLNDRENFFG